MKNIDFPTRPFTPSFFTLDVQLRLYIFPLLHPRSSWYMLAWIYFMDKRNTFQKDIPSLQNIGGNLLYLSASSKLLSKSRFNKLLFWEHYLKPSPISFIYLCKVQVDTWFSGIPASLRMSLLIKFPSFLRSSTV